MNHQTVSYDYLKKNNEAQRATVKTFYAISYLILNISIIK